MDQHSAEAEFFRENREEIVEMGSYEFDQELYDKVLREDGEAIGIKKGKKIGKKEGMQIGIRIYQEILEVRRSILRELNLQLP